MCRGPTVFIKKKKKCVYVDVAPFKPVSYKGLVRMGRRRGRVSFQTAVSGSLVRLAQEEGPEWAGPTPPGPTPPGRGGNEADEARLRAG